MRSITELLINFQDIAIVSLLQVGLSNEEIANATLQDLRLEEGFLSVGDGVYRVSQETIYSIVNSYFQDMYYINNGETGEIFKLQSGSNIVRGIEGEESGIKL